MVQDKTLGGRIFHAVNVLVMLFLMLITFYPFYFSIVNSLNDGNDLYKGMVMLWPRQFSMESWRTVMADRAIMKSLWITASRTAIVTVVSTVYTAMFAYAFSRPYLRAKKLYTVLGFTSMYFSGGIIASFVLMNWLGLYDSYWVYIVPALFGGFWNVIIFNANFKALPDSLFESAKLDGANEYRIFFQIVLPLSKPVVAALAVFTAVGTWNDYSVSLYFTQTNDIQTLQYYILKLIKSHAAVEQLAQAAGALDASVYALANSAQGSGPVTAKTIELSAMVLAAIPMVILYPFAQKFFEKGVLLGSVKG